MVVLSRKRIIILSIELALSFATFIVVSLALFATSTEVQTTPIELNVGSGLISSYEIRFYTGKKFINMIKTLMILLFGMVSTIG